MTIAFLVIETRIEPESLQETMQYAQKEHIIYSKFNLTRTSEEKNVRCKTKTIQGL